MLKPKKVYSLYRSSKNLTLIKDLVSRKQTPFFIILRNSHTNEPLRKNVWLASSLLSGALSIGGLIAYANYNPEFRKTLEIKLPIFRSLSKYLYTKPEPSPQVRVSELPKELDKNVSVEKAIQPDIIADELYSISSSNPSNVSEMYIQFERHSSELLKDLQIALKDASQAIESHKISAMKLISMGDFENWEALSELSQEKSLKIYRVTNIRSQIQNIIGEAKTYLSNHKLENFERDESADFQKLITSVELSLHELNVKTLSSSNSNLESFDLLVDNGWKNLKKDLIALLPDLNFKNEATKLSPDDMKLAVAHFERKIMHLIAISAYQNVIHNKVLFGEVEKKTEMFGNESETDLEDKLQQQRIYLNLINQKQLLDIKATYNAELEHEFKRQSAAHDDNLQHAIRKLENQIKENFSESLYEKLSEEKFLYHEELSKHLGRLKGLEESLRARMELEMSSRKSLAFWLACQNLEAIVDGSNLDSSVKTCPLLLSKHFDLVKKLSGNNPLVSEIIELLPKEIISEGIFTKAALILRFNNVEKQCKKVALIGEYGGNLLQYFLSYLHNSLLISEAPKIHSQEVYHGSVDIESLSTHEIFVRARQCLERDDFFQAIRFLNLLKGAPMKLAADWLHDAKLYLETYQAAKVLLCHAFATDIMAYQ